MIEIKEFKGVWQVKRDGYTLDQFQEKRDAEVYAAMQGEHAAVRNGIGRQQCGRTAYVTGRARL